MASRRISQDQLGYFPSFFEIFSRKYLLDNLLLMIYMLPHQCGTSPKLRRTASPYLANHCNVANTRFGGAAEACKTTGTSHDYNE
jgi:hypothetical protein